MLTVQDYVQAIVADLVITDPVGRPIFFAMLTQSMTPSERRRAAMKVSGAVAIILGGTALVGKVLLDTIGIHLGAFGFTGGFIIAVMGLEMMGMGQPSKAQGGKESRDAPDPKDHLLVPFTMPFIAGPGGDYRCSNLVHADREYELRNHGAGCSWRGRSRTGFRFPVSDRLSSEDLRADHERHYQVRRLDHRNNWRTARVRWHQKFF